MSALPTKADIRVILSSAPYTLARRRCVAAIIIETLKGCWDDVVAHVKGGHAYSNPVLLVIPMEGATAGYLDWLTAEIAEK